ncbi:MAG TPA: hypothetical protein VLV28_00265 [Gaiellaceae bacterium]|nr:hypothetical protein [Gaiellaceae bacterium]
MASTVQVEAARIPDRDRLLALLLENDLDARPHDEVGIDVFCEDEQGSVEVYAYVEAVIMDIGASFVPIKHEGVIYIRPPVG